MKLWKWLLASLAISSLVACGGSVSSSDADADGGGGTEPPPVAADLSLVLSSTSVRNTGADRITATVTAVDASRNALPGIPIAIAVDNDALVVTSGSETDASGSVTGDVSIGANKANRLITVTATSGDLVRSAVFQVVGARLDSTLLPAVVSPGDAGTVQFRLVDAASNAMVGQEITVSGSGLTPFSGTTGTNGELAYSYTAPAQTGNLSINAAAGGTTNTATVIVQAVGTIPVVDAGRTPVRSASVSANPSVVSVNASGTTNRTELRALFVSDGNAPVANVRVRFDLNGDRNSIGGTIATGTNVLYSDANGVATSAYVPGSRSSPTDGVTVRACWDYGDFAEGACPNEALTTLTVNAEPLSVTIGTNNVIESGADGLTYIKKFVVLVVDSAGQAKPDVEISPSIDLTHFYKGYYVPQWTLALVSPACPNEDVNRNAVLEAGEDLNSNGQLDPRKSDVAITVVGSNRTNESGVVIVQIEYPKNVATWVDYKILVAASGIAGSEGRATFSGQLTAAVTEFSGTASPSFQFSPYGRSNTDCHDPD